MSENLLVTLRCLNCCTKSPNTQYHEIFDEVGHDLQLAVLLEKYLHLVVIRSDLCTQVLCNKCLTMLLERFDTEEHIKLNEEDGEEDDNDEANGDDTVEMLEDVEFTEATEECRVLHLRLPEMEVLGGSNSTQTSGESAESNNTIIYDIREMDSDEDGMQEIDCEINFEGNNETIEEISQEELQSHSDTVESPLLQYLNSTINSHLDGLEFDWETSCNICNEQFITYQELLKHVKFVHKPEYGYVCIYNTCNNVYPSLRRLAAHIVLSHSDLQKLQIYGSCPHCGFRYSNYLHFNKHSCFRSIKRKVGVQSHCDDCDIEFQSFKRFIFHMQFHLPVCRPKMCMICGTEFTDIDELFEHVTYSHNPKGTLACVKCDRFFKDKKFFEEHKRSHRLRFKYECQYCCKKYDYKHLLQQHMEGCHKEKLAYHNEFKCDLCAKIFHNDASLRKHMKLHTPEVLVRGYVCDVCGEIARDEVDLTEHLEDADSPCYGGTIQEEIFSVSFTCEYCSKNFKEPADLKKHRATGVHDDYMYECTMCKKKFEELKKMRVHTKCHPNYDAWMAGFPIERLFMCNKEECEETYSQWVALYHHKRRNHIQTCRGCQITFHTIREYEDHKLVCKAKIEYKCQFCFKECKTKMSRAVHIARSHNNRNVICSECGASYKSELDLQQHIELVHVPVECKLCYKTIKNLLNYRTHERVVHKSEQRYFCKLCNKGFYYKSERDAHEKVIHTEEVHKCTQCKFTTIYPKSLEVHMAKHTKTYKFKCHLCPRQFTRKHVLTVHIKRHEAQRTFICSDRVVNGCDASFISNYLLNKHVRDKHGDEPEAQLVLVPKRRKVVAATATITKPVPEPEPDPEVEPLLESIIDYDDADDIENVYDVYDADDSAAAANYQTVVDDIPFSIEDVAFSLEPELSTYGDNVTDFSMINDFVDGSLPHSDIIELDLPVHCTEDEISSMFLL